MKLEDLIIRHEAIRLTAYTDTTGHQTIGVGHNLDASPIDSSLYLPDGSITVATATELLEDDIAAAMKPLVLNCSPWFQALDPVRQAVLVDMSFNMGWPTFSQFSTFFGLVASGAYTYAASDMLKTAWAREVWKRANEDAAMMLTGDWPSP